MRDVIKSFRHKGLQLFFKAGSMRDIVPDHAGKFSRLLDRLDASASPSDMNLPAYKLHKMSGREEGT